MIYWIAGFIWNVAMMIENVIGMSVAMGNVCKKHGSFPWEIDELTLINEMEREGRGEE